MVPVSPGSASDGAATSLGVMEVLRQAEGRLAQPLQQKLQVLVQELETARDQVREQGRQSAQLQRTLEEQRHAISRAGELEDQNQLFTTRVTNDEEICDGLPGLLAEERLEWERCRLAAEDLAVERQLLREFQIAAEKDKERRRNLAAEARGVDSELAELT